MRLRLKKDCFISVTNYIKKSENKMSNLIGKASVLVGAVGVGLIIFTAIYSYSGDVSILLPICDAFGIVAIVLGVATWILSELKMNIGIFAIIMGINIIIFYYLIPLL